MAPLEADTDAGEASDHKMVLMRPLSAIDNRKRIESKTIETRKFSEENFTAMGRALEAYDWSFLKGISSINERMKAFHDTLFGLFSTCFPLRKKVILSENEPFIDEALMKLRRKRNREYNKHRRSEKYLQLETRYQGLLSKSMKRFYRRRIQSLKTTNPRQWYRGLKRIAGYDARDENPIVEEIKHLSDVEQAEHIAESFAKISNEYSPLDRSMIQVPNLDKSDYLKTNAKEVADTISSLNANKSVPKNDIPTRILKRFSGLISEPIAELVNDCIAEGVWPDFLKIESVTPVPKVTNPQSANDLT